MSPKWELRTLKNPNPVHTCSNYVIWTPCLMHRCVCIWQYILQNYNYKLHFQNLSIYHIPHVFIRTLAAENLDVCTACDPWDSNIQLTMVKDQRRQIYPKSQSLSRIRNGPNLSTSLMRPSTQIPLSLPPPPHHQLCIFHPGNSAFNVILRICQAAFALKSGETLNPEILRAESEVVFLCSQHVPNMFPSSSQWVIIRFRICSLGSQCVPQGCSQYTSYKVLPTFCFISINWGLPIGCIKFLCSKTVHHHFWAGLIPHYKLGGTYYFSLGPELIPLLKSNGTYFVPPLKTGGTYCDSY